MKFLFDLLRKKGGSAAEVTPFRALMQKYVDQLPPLHARNNNNKCFVVLSAGLRFGYTDKAPIQALSRYVSDASLFELSCFSIASAEFWAFNKAPHQRGEIQDLLIGQLDAIATRSGFLAAESAYRYANSRMMTYGGLRVKGADHDAQYYFLKLAIRHTIKHAAVADKLEEVEPTFSDALEDFYLTQQLMDWDIRRIVEMDIALSEFK